MQRLFLIGAVLISCLADAAGLPKVLDNVMLQQNGSVVTISYALDTVPAIVTLELEADGAPLDPACLTNVKGEVNKVVTSTGRQTLTWRPTKTSLRGQKIGNCRAKVTAWPLERPPDYMVVDMLAESSARVRYYATTNDLPGGLFANEDYRKNKLVMRLIRAKGVEWMMGNIGESMKYTSGGVPSYRDATAEAPHMVTLTNDYWMGVFEITQTQWPLMGSGYFYNASTFKVDGAMRPAEGVNFCLIRHGNTNTSADRSAYYYPAAPSANSWLGVLRARTGLRFDLPGEAQWEFACRAGTGEGEFNNGFRCNNQYGYGADTGNATYDTGTGSFPGRIQVHGGGDNQKPSTVGPTNATAIVGSYEPNKWGLYDMHGNVAEWCLDWYAADITGLNGAINANGVNYADGTEATDKKRVSRGGFWWGYSTLARSSSRSAGKAYGIPAALEYDISKAWGSAHGFRVVCELQTEADFVGK